MSRTLAVCCTVLGAGSMWAQAVISAHSGVIQYVEGQVSVESKAIHPKFAEFPDVKNGQTLATQDGRSEILLTPGVFLRLSENSSFRMVSNQLADTRVQLISGSALVEVDELLANNAITVQCEGAQIALLKKGLYRFDADRREVDGNAPAARLRVYEGEARVTSGSDAAVAKRGREVELGAVLESHSFDVKSTDAFYRWSARRADYVAAANVSSARSVGNYSGMGYTGAGSGYGSWAWNPYLGMFTFLPSSGIYWSPFGVPFFSPLSVSTIYFPAYGGGVVRTPLASSVNAAPRTPSSAASAPLAAGGPRNPGPAAGPNTGFGNAADSGTGTRAAASTGGSFGASLGASAPSAGVSASPSAGSGTRPAAVAGPRGR